MRRLQRAPVQLLIAEGDSAEAVAVLLAAVQARADVLETHARLGNLVEERALQKWSALFIFGLRF